MGLLSCGFWFVLCIEAQGSMIYNKKRKCIAGLQYGKYGRRIPQGLRKTKTKMKFTKQTALACACACAALLCMLLMTYLCYVFVPEDAHPIRVLIYMILCFIPIFFLENGIGKE